MATGCGTMQLVQLMQGEAAEMKEINITHHHNHNGIPGRRLLAPRVSAARVAWACLQQRSPGEPACRELDMLC